MNGKSTKMAPLAHANRKYIIPDKRSGQRKINANKI